MQTLRRCLLPPSSGPKWPLDYMGPEYGNSKLLCNVGKFTNRYVLIYPPKLEWFSVFNERGANLRACFRSRTPVRQSCSLPPLSFPIDATTWSNKMQFSTAIWSNRSTNIVSKLIYQPLVSWNLQNERERERWRDREKRESRSRWPRGLKRILSSISRKLSSWLRIRARVFVPLFSKKCYQMSKIFVLLQVMSGLEKVKRPNRQRLNNNIKKIII